MRIQTKLLTGVLAIGVTVALVGGSTMAWFTDSKSVGASQFTAGTVTLDDKSSNVTVDALNKDNVNPGDTFHYGLNIVYTGSKPVYLRVKAPTVAWSNKASTDNVLVNDVTVGSFLTGNGIGKDWNYKTINGTGYFVYTGGDNGIIHGTADDGSYKAWTDPNLRTVPVSLPVKFDGNLTTNIYQGSNLNVGAYTIEVIQATNDAANQDSDWTNGNSIPSASQS